MSRPDTWTSTEADAGAYERCVSDCDARDEALSRHDLSPVADAALMEWEARQPRPALSALLARRPDLHCLALAAVLDEAGRTA